LYDHVDVYLDESGDLGFSGRSPEHFVIVALATAEPYKLVRIVRKAHRKFSLVDGAGSEFKFNRSRGPLRRFLLDGIVKTDSWLVWGSIAKSRIPPRLRSDKEELWQHVAARTVAELWFCQDSGGDLGGHSDMTRSIRLRPCGHRWLV
jgi:hypothetical protein